MIAGSLGEVWEHAQGSLDEALSAARIQASVRPDGRRPADLFLHGALSLAVSKAFAKPRLGLGGARPPYAPESRIIGPAVSFPISLVRVADHKTRAWAS